MKLAANLQSFCNKVNVCMKLTKNIFKLVSEPIVSGRTLAAVSAGVAAVAAAPAVLAGAGFTAAGVAAGSLAAMLQVLTCTIIIIVYWSLAAMLHVLTSIIIINVYYD